MRRNKLIFPILIAVAAAAWADDSAPPKQKVSIADLLRSATGYSGQPTSVAGVRGLEESDGPVDTKARDFAAIDKLDHLAIHDDEIKKFVDEGNLR